MYAKLRLWVRTRPLTEAQLPRRGTSPSGDRRTATHLGPGSAGARNCSMRYTLGRRSLRNNSSRLFGAQIQLERDHQEQAEPDEHDAGAIGYLARHSTLLIEVNQTVSQLHRNEQSRLASARLHVSWIGNRAPILARPAGYRPRRVVVPSSGATTTIAGYQTWAT